MDTSNRSIVGLCLTVLLSGMCLLQTGCTNTTVISQADEPAPEAYQDFGEPMDTAAPPILIDAVMADPAAYTGRDLVLQGTVRDVCQKRGCWITLGSDDLGQAVIVKFTCPIEGHLIPANAEGQTALAAGRLEFRQVNEAYARHLAEDNGASPEAVAQIVGPQQMLWLGSPSARVYGINASPTSADN